MHEKRLFCRNFIKIAVFLLCCNFSLFAESKLDVFTSIPPIAFFVEQIGGDAVTVNSIINENGNPHTYTPTPRQIMALGRAKIFFTIGVPAEKIIVKKIKALSKPLRVIDLTKGIKFREMRSAHESHTHGHNVHGHKDAHDPHVWLGIAQIKVIATNITEALSDAEPANVAKFKANLKLFLEKLNTLEKKFSSKLLCCKGDTVFVYHPSFGYFTDAFGLKQEPVEIEGKSPSPRQVIELIKNAKKRKVKMIFVQPQFDTNAAANIAKAINGSVVSINPMRKNVFKNMEYMVEKIRGAVSQ